MDRWRRAYFRVPLPLRVLSYSMAGVALGALADRITSGPAGSLVGGLGILLIGFGAVVEIIHKTRRQSHEPRESLPLVTSLLLWIIFVIGLGRLLDAVKSGRIWNYLGAGVMAVFLVFIIRLSRGPSITTRARGHSKRHK